MRIINLFGGPGSGKSTSAAAIFAFLKNNGVKAELVHEAAKRFLYKGAQAQLGNQFYVLAKQYSNIYDLERSGCDVAISDSPLISNLMYAEGLPYYEQLKALILRLSPHHFNNCNIFVVRTKEFTNFGRTQNTIEEAATLDVKSRQLMYELGQKFDFEAQGNPEGQMLMAEHALEFVSPAKFRHYLEAKNEVKNETV